MAVSEGFRRVVRGLVTSVAAAGGFVLLLQLIPDLRTEDEKFIQDKFDDIDIRKALAVHRERKHNAKD